MLELPSLDMPSPLEPSLLEPSLLEPPNLTRDLPIPGPAPSVAGTKAAPSPAEVRGPARPSLSWG